MSAPGTPDCEKLTREVVTRRLKNTPAEAAAAAAAEIAQKAIVERLPVQSQRHDPHLTVTGACRGVMSGMLLIDKDLILTSVELVKSMAPIAQETRLDPADMMTWAMEAIAAISLMGPPDLGTNIREALEQNFMGTGEVFGELLAKAAKSRRP
jgi:hypothetical protein